MEKYTKIESCFMIILLLVMLLNSEAIAAVAYSDEKPLQVGDTVEDTKIVPRWAYTNVATEMLHINPSTGYAECTLIASGGSTVSSISVYMYLEKKTGSSTYVVVNSWNKVVNGRDLQLTKNLFLRDRGTYRVHGEYYVYNQDGRCEIITGYSDLSIY